MRKIRALYGKCIAATLAATLMMSGMPTVPAHAEEISGDLSVSTVEDEKEEVVSVENETQGNIESAQSESTSSMETGEQNRSIVLKETSYVFDGSYHEPDFTFTCTEEGKEISLSRSDLDSTDKNNGYSYQYDGNRNAGQASVTVYKGDPDEPTATASFTIVPAEDMEITADYSYTKGRYPNVSACYGTGDDATSMIYGEDYYFTVVPAGTETEEEPENDESAVSEEEQSVKEEQGTDDSTQVTVVTRLTGNFNLDTCRIVSGGTYSYTPVPSSFDKTCITGINTENTELIYTGFPIILEDSVYILDSGQKDTDFVETEGEGTFPYLLYGEDYLITYENNTDASKEDTLMKVKVTGKGLYEGSEVEFDFSISACPMKDVSIQVDPVPSSGNEEAVPDVTLRLGSGEQVYELKEGTDYTVSYTGNKGFGTGAAVFTGTGNFEGTEQRNFLIYSNRVSDCAFRYADTYEYTGKEIRPSGLVITTPANTELEEGTDYTVSYTGNINAGTARMTIQGIGEFTGTAVMEYTIKPCTAVSVAAFAKAATEEAFLASITCSRRDNAAVLLRNTDYTVKSEKNSDNSIRVTVAGMGNYSFTHILNYMVPSSTTSAKAGGGQGNIKKVTGFKIKVTKYKKKKYKKKVVLTWKKVKDVTGYEIVYGKKKKGTFKHLAYTKKLKYTKKWKKNKKYCYKVRAYKKTRGGKSFGAFSTVKKK